MPRTVEYDDPSIQAGFGVNKEKQYRAKAGEQHIIRVITSFDEYLIHAVNDVLPPKPNGEDSVFNMSCARKWDEDSGEWVGECLGHDREEPYEEKPRYVCGILLLAIRQGKSMLKLEPEDAPRYWDMAKGSLLDLRQTAENAGKKLNEIELLISLKKEEGAQQMQKIKVDCWQGERLTTKAHIEAGKAQHPALTEECARPATIEEQKKRLKKRKPTKKAEQDSDEIDLDIEGEEKPAPRKSAIVSKKAAPAAEDEEDPGEEADAPPAEDDDIPFDGGAPAPAPTKKAAPAPAPKKTAVAVAFTTAKKKSTEDEEVDKMLADLEGGDDE